MIFHFRGRAPRCPLQSSLRLFALALVSAITTPLVFAQDPLLVNPQVTSPVVLGHAYTSGPNVQKVREQDQRLTITSVVNGASFEPGIAAGSWVTIFGEDLAPTTRIWRDDEIVGGVLPTSLDGVQALINGKPAAIFFISPGQLNVQAPDDTTLGPVSVEVVQESGASVTTLANLQEASPAFFLFNPEGRRFLAAVHPDGVFVGKPDLFGGTLLARPAEPGNIILLFGTGFGLTAPPVPSGRVLSGGAVRLANTVRVRFNGVDADVRFAGLSGAGLNQVNVVVPEGLPSGDVEVVAEILDLVTQSGAFVTLESPGTPPPPPRPSVTLTAEPEFIVRGESAALKWMSQNATSAELSPGIGPVATNGSLVVFPSSTTTYTITVKGDGGEASAAVRVTVREPTPPPSAPTNLKATAVSQVRIDLSWTNTATNARSVRVELRVGSSGAFREFPSSFNPRTNALGVIQLSALTTYTFRVRAEGEGGFSPYSNLASATTQAKLTIFLVHPNPTNVCSLANTLRDPLFGIDQQRFDFDCGFDYRECRPTAPGCPSDCDIRVGARRLANHINQQNPQGEIVILGYSMGGLVARDMLLNNYSGVITRRTVAALITMATPNGGYPFSFPDNLLLCGPVLKQMDGNWRSRQSENIVVLSDYLGRQLNGRWGNSSFAGNPQRWFVISGTSCTNPIRRSNPTTGCPDWDVFSDGIVCNASAQLRINYPMNKPTRSWSSQMYDHGKGFETSVAQFLVFCNLNYALCRSTIEMSPSLASTIEMSPLDQIRGWPLRLAG